MEVVYIRLAERVFVALCMPILLCIGYRLFANGATGKMNLTAKSGAGPGNAGWCGMDKSETLEVRVAKV